MKPFESALLDELSRYNFISLFTLFTIIFSLVSILIVHHFNHLSLHFSTNATPKITLWHSRFQLNRFAVPRNQASNFASDKEMGTERKINSIRTSNEDREIAVFEEENLALRRELQEARASRTLAENHVAKCVDFAVSRSVTPVTFDTPCITSTPVRTALTDTRFLLPAIPPASYTSSASSVLRSRSAEVAALQPIFEADQCQNFTTDCEPVSLEDSPTKEAVCKRAEMFLASCHTAVTSTSDDVIDILDKIAKYSGLIDNGSICKILTKIEVEDHLGFRAKEARNAIENDDKITSTEEERRMMSLRPLNSIPEELLDELLRTKIKYFQSREENKVEDQEILEQQKDLSDKPSEADVVNEAEKLANDNHSFWQKLCKFHNQPGRFKKPRRKKGSVKKLFSETDQLDEVPCQDTEVLTDKVPPCASESTAEEDEDRFPNDDRTNQAIVDVPDVVVIGGGSIVPKNLCSMRTLTSRTQTAPSRATYTTAYI